MDLCPLLNYHAVMTVRTGVADLPLHYGRVPRWLAERMSALARAIVEVIVEERGPEEFLRRLSDPFWFQAFGCVLGMDWHSSGMTTSVIGALKHALEPMADSVGLYVCGGRGKHSRRTPDELRRVGERTGLDGDALGRTSRLVARVDNNAVQDGHTLYLHGFLVSAGGLWVVIQQGMCPDTRTARRYHWRSDRVEDFVNEPHEAVVGQSRGVILNLTDRRSEEARKTIQQLGAEPPDTVVAEVKRLRHATLPAHHEVRPTDVFLRRLHATLEVAHRQPPSDFADLMLVPGLGPRTLEALALVSEVVYGASSRFEDPARFAFAHGGKDGHPHPVPTKVYDRTIATLRNALAEAKLGRSEKIQAFRRLERQVRLAESTAVGADLATLKRRGWEQADAMGGRTVSMAPGATRRSRKRLKQLTLPGLDPDNLN